MKKVVGKAWQELVDREISGRRIDLDIVSSLWHQSHCLYQKDLLAHFGCVNAVEFSNDGQFLASGNFKQQH